MKHSLLIILTLLQFALGAHQVSAQTIAELKDDWTKLEIGFVLEGDNGDNSRISGSCVRFLKIENSDKIVQEVCLYRKGNVKPTWSIVETEKVRLIDLAAMKLILKKFDDLHASESRKWRSLNDSEKDKILDKRDSSGGAHWNRMAYRIERQNNISGYGSYVGVYFQDFSKKGASFLNQLAGR